MLLKITQSTLLTRLLILQVSGGVLSRILARNSNMKDLNIRGCTQLAVHPFDFSLAQKTFEWENVEAGWGLSDSTFSSFGFSSWKLQNLAVGVGGSISRHTLLCISERCPDLKRLSLCFQVGTYSTFSCMENGDCTRRMSY
jgi:hypothetical protein